MVDTVKISKSRWRVLKERFKGTFNKKKKKRKGRRAKTQNSGYSGMPYNATTSYGATATGYPRYENPVYITQHVPAPASAPVSPPKQTKSTGSQAVQAPLRDFGVQAGDQPAISTQTETHTVDTAVGPDPVEIENPPQVHHPSNAASILPYRDQPEQEDDDDAEPQGTAQDLLAQQFLAEHQARQDAIEQRREESKKSEVDDLLDQVHLGPTEKTRKKFTGLNIRTIDPEKGLRNRWWGGDGAGKGSHLKVQYVDQKALNKERAKGNIPSSRLAQLGHGTQKRKEIQEQNSKLKRLNDQQKTREAFAKGQRDRDLDALFMQTHYNANVINSVFNPNNIQKAEAYFQQYAPYDATPHLYDTTVVFPQLPKFLD